MNTEQKCRTTYIEGFMNVYIGGYRKTYSHDYDQNEGKRRAYKNRNKQAVAELCQAQSS